jgi:4-amino-4-deoxy-L-arabinose transferase-like glycosyltransferase
VTPAARQALLWPLLVAIVVRLCCLPLGADIPPSGDAFGYIYLATEFRETGSFAELAQGVRPPLFRVLIAPGIDLSTEPPSAFPGAYLIQIGMDVAAMALLMRVARRRLGDRAAIAAGWIYALLPQAILFSSAVIMAETVAVLAIAVALVALDNLDRALDRPGARIAPRVAALGIVLGLGILTKEVLVPVAAMFLLALLLRPGRPLLQRARMVLAAGALAAVVITPWVAWTHQRYGVPILSGTYGDISMGLDNTPPGITSRRYFKELYVRDVKAKLRMAHAVFRRALVDYPGLTAVRSWVRLRIATGPEDVLPIWIALTYDGFMPDASSNFALSRQCWVLPEGWGRRVQLVCGAATLVFFALGAAGLAARKRDVMSTVAVLALLVLLATLALTVSSARYRHSLVPFLLPHAGLAASLLLARLRGLELPQHGTRRAAWCGLAVAVLLTVTLFVLPAP